jgi:hypothetical protein
MAEGAVWARRCIELGELTGYLHAIALGSEFLAETLVCYSSSEIPNRDDRREERV